MVFLTQINNANSSLIEEVGNFFESPGRLLMGTTYTLEKTEDGKFILKQPETFNTMYRIALKITAITFFPLSILSTLLGSGLKWLSYVLYPELKQKYLFPVLVNARISLNFSGILPQNPLTPNCVNTQQKSFWGKLYNADPIVIPKELKDPMAVMKNIFKTSNRPFFKAENVRLTEETDHYLHYEYTVVIPSGGLKGTYIDDVDLYFNEEKSCFEIRSASRVGFRDAVHFDFSSPGANKSRVEAIREEFEEVCCQLCDTSLSS